VCMTVRKALGEHPTWACRRRRLQNSLRVSAPTPRVRPHTHSVATTRRISQTRPSGVSHNDDSGYRSRCSMAWRWRCTLLVESPVRAARLRRLGVPCARIAVIMTILLAHNPIVSVGPLLRDCTLACIHSLRVPDRYSSVPLCTDTRILGVVPALGAQNAISLHSKYYIMNQ
jgi:hypothetical protein